MYKNDSIHMYKIMKVIVILQLYMSKPGNHFLLKNITLIIYTKFTTNFFEI
jgi:hypothetical protein